MIKNTAATDTSRREAILADIAVPPVIFGTSALGNLFMALEYIDKYTIVRECLHLSGGAPVFDSAGKYGVGLALESLGAYLRALRVKPDEVVISNKLGWLRTSLQGPEPSFEPGVWKDIRHDAVQKIGYEGILECFEQGNRLLNGYSPQLVSVHDPDEYLARATGEEHAKALYNDVLEAYRALYQLKTEGKVRAIGVGAKDWRTIQRIARDVSLDWVMFATSMTILRHPAELLLFIRELEEAGVFVINSAVFHSGFLVGGSYYDYQPIQPDMPEHQALFQWREQFFRICKDFSIKPAEACVQFALQVPGVKSIALNTSDAGRVKQNITMAHARIPAAFWQTLRAQGLIRIEVG